MFFPLKVLSFVRTVDFLAYAFCLYIVMCLPLFYYLMDIKLCYIKESIYRTPAIIVQNGVQ